MTAERGNAEIWVIDDDRSIRFVLEKAIAKSGMRARAFASGDAALKALENESPPPPDVVLCDVRMPGTGGMELLAELAAHHPELPVIMMTAYSDLESTVSAYREGAFEFLAKPLDLNDALAVIERAVAHSAGTRADTGEGEEDGRGAATGIIGAAPAMQEVFRAIGRLARSTVTVLLTGESGTGKELVARALHANSPSANGPFVAVNTPAVPPDLLESELFGHERGAFTGAHARHRGRFEQAHGGTLFLDEIGDMPPELQTRLLRVLAEQEFHRVGGHTPVRVKVRVIAATHQALAERVADGRFREDLFHRLNVIGIHLPALRERREDIPMLARHFLDAAAAELGVEAKTLPAEARDQLMRFAWPGNVRELENLCRRLTVMAPGREILLADLPPGLEASADTKEGAATPDALRMSTADDVWEEALARWARGHLQRGEAGLMDDALPRFERVLIEAALDACDGARGEAARLLGWGRNTLTRKLAALKGKRSESSSS